MRFVSMSGTNRGERVDFTDFMISS